MTLPVYDVRCNDCKVVINQTTKLSRSAAGGLCRACAEA